MPSSLIKPHLEYPDLIRKLRDRGMVISDEERAVRKLSQIGYYRLSGFWYPCRKPKFDSNGRYLKDSTTNLPIRDDKFQENVDLNDIIDLYLFDKKLRQLMLDAIERIEIYMRSIIAHEIGRIDPLAYRKKEFISPSAAETTKKEGVTVNHWGNWMKKLCERIEVSKEDSIRWHRDRGCPIPFWAVVECWDYGLMSKYFENLNGRCKQKIINRLEIKNPAILANWLQEIGILRNKCAHHSRIWNREASNPISIKAMKDDPYFQNLNLKPEAWNRIYGHICVLWYLVKKIGPSSTWINKVADLIDSKPKIDSCPFTAMGFPDNKGFPREKFDLPPQ
jgi:abortive infection bacteriophage resistance protein